MFKINTKMILQFTNKQVYFALQSIWNSLDYRFKYQINQLVTANDADTFVQDIEVNVDTLMQCYNAISLSSYGSTTDMAEELLDSLRTQLLAEANIADYLAYIASLETASPLPEVIPNEQAQALLKIQEAKERDIQIVENKVLNGKAQILA